MMADQKTVLRLLKTARGQMDGIIKMVEEDRYCLEVSSQIMAAQSILKKANRLVLKAHMNSCVREAVDSGEAMLNRANQEILAAHLKHCVKTASTEAEREQKIDELIGMLGKLLK